ncbi:hypothetical protein JQN58_31270 [Aneurinibacillus sp. BA2021]|nr:hypothetical protein [Aneurinibacillus sp. BA2021]
MLFDSAGALLEKEEDQGTVALLLRPPPSCHVKGAGDLRRVRDVGPRVLGRHASSVTPAVCGVTPTSTKADITRVIARR